MKTLSRNAYESVKDYISTNSRLIEQARLKQYIEGNHESEITQALSAYQNPDGGFGHGLEADFRLPDSSPMATSVALQILLPIDHTEQAHKMIEEAISYFEQSFDKQRQGWFAVPPAVNDHPHAFWWTVHENGKSWIDDHWGNPSAEIIGYLLRYREYVSKLDVDQLAQQAIGHFLSLESFKSEHELFCYLRFFEMHPSYLNDPVQEQINKAVHELVVTERTEWNNYVPFPLKFQPSPYGIPVGISDQYLEDNLDYFVELLEQRPYIEPSWEWNSDLEVWEEAKKEWQGVLSLETLQWLTNYERLKA